MFFNYDKLANKHWGFATATEDGRNFRPIIYRDNVHQLKTLGYCESEKVNPLFPELDKIVRPSKAEAIEAAWELLKSLQFSPSSASPS